MITTDHILNKQLKYNQSSYFYKFHWNQHCRLRNGWDIVPDRFFAPKRGAINSAGL